MADALTDINEKVFAAVDNWSSKLRWRVALSGNEGNPFYKHQSKRPQAVPFRNYGKPTELEEQLDRLIAYIADGVHDSAAAVVRPELLRPEVVPPEIVRPEVVRPELLRPEVVRPEVARP